LGEGPIIRWYSCDEFEHRTKYIKTATTSNTAIKSDNPNTGSDRAGQMNPIPSRSSFLNALKAKIKMEENNW
jgi:hypothetical protein